MAVPGIESLWDNLQNVNSAMKLVCLISHGSKLYAVFYFEFRATKYMS